MVEVSKTKTCRYCKYQWFAVTEEPKACPRCKRRFDYIKRKLVIDLDNNSISGVTTAGEIKKSGLIRSSMGEGEEE